MVLGVHSFLDPGSRVGIQFIAEGLAEYGWQVDYLSVPSSPFDLYRRWGRLSRVWIDRQDEKGVEIKPGLIEHAFRTFHPAHKLFLRSRWLMEHYCRLVPGWLHKRHYDICIHDITVNVLFLHLIQADLFVLRLNDPPDGFAFNIHQLLIDRFKENISSRAYDEIWAVSEPLSKYALHMNSANRVVVMPNGIEDRFLSNTDNGEHRPKTAIFLGRISQWVDLSLLDQTALLLPDWTFHVYGTWDRQWTGHASNLHRFPPLDRKDVPGVLSGYQVGLIPFRDTAGRMAYVERPIKFYEYIATGLGVASTDIGALRSGMGDLTAYGNTPHGFANAIEQAAHDGTVRTHAFNQRFVQDHTWNAIFKKICMRISRLRDRKGSL